MSTVSVRIPQIGEGLQEARLVAVLKQPGESIRRDEPIYQMETDKAVMDVESPVEGTLVEWLANPDDVLPIGAEVARVEVATEAMAVSDGSVAGGLTAVNPTALPEELSAEGTSRTAMGNLQLPPRTRAYARDKGLREEELALVPLAGTKLTPDDIDAYLAQQAGTPAAGQPIAKPQPAKSSGRFEERPVPPKQRVLNSRMIRGNALVVPGTISVAVNWEPIERERARIKRSGDAFQPSAFTMFAYAVAQALPDFPGLRTSLRGDETFRTYHHAALGIAVSLPQDELVLAVVEDADTLSWREFADRTRERIELARTGKDQASEAVTLSLTNMQGFGIRDAIPVVVPPAVATLFIGEVYTGLDPDADGLKPRRTCNLALTFDHRVLNGVGAAQFLNAVKSQVETIESLLVSAQ